MTIVLARNWEMEFQTECEWDVLVTRRLPGRRVRYRGMCGNMLKVHYELEWKWPYIILYNKK